VLVSCVYFPVLCCYRNFSMNKVDYIDIVAWTSNRRTRNSSDEDASSSDDDEQLTAENERASE